MVERGVVRAVVTGLAALLVGCGSAQQQSTSTDRASSPRTVTEQRVEMIDRPFAPEEEAVARSLARSFTALDPRRRTIDLDELMVGQVPDGIPAIDRPQFDSAVEAARWLDPREPVVVLSLGDDARAYPLQILIWHEIVNDVVGGVPLAVSFCPLCNTAITFERTLEGQVLEFGTSGLLRRSDLVMYDRQTISLWQQVTGEAIVGAAVPSRLAFVPSPIVSFEAFAEAHPTGRVLNRETGFRRAYGSNPYVGYDTIGSSPLFPVREFEDGRLEAKERVLTVEANGEAIAFPFETLTQKVVIHAAVGGEPVVAFWQPGTLSPLDERFVVGGRNIGAAVAYRPHLDDRALRFEARDGRIVDVETGSRWDILGRATAGPLKGRSLEPVVSGNHFWFAWSAFRPDTRVVD